jgi:glycogen debranching enzyme
MCLDDSPRFFPFAAEGRMALREPVCAPDLLFFCARDRHHLAWLAERLGRDAEAATHRQEAARLAALCDAELYDPARQRYVDRGESGRASPVDSPFNHFPAALSPRPAVRSRAAAALGRTGPFWGRYGVTSIATDEACFDPYRGFRGAIWFAVNYLCAASCRLLGDAATAEAIVAASGELIRAEPGMAKGFRENYHYLSGAGTGAHHFPTLSAAPFLSLLLGHDRGESAPRAD